MSKVRNLPEITTLADDDLLYTVDQSTNPNGGRKITKANLKTNLELTAAEVKTKYESNANTNAYTDAEKSKLAGIEAGATADQIASEVPYDNTTSNLSATNVQDAIDEVDAIADGDFNVSINSGLIAHYTGGKVRFNGTFSTVLAGNILLSPNITNGRLYVDVDGIVKQTGSNTDAPAYTVVFAMFSTDATDITLLVDRRVKISQNLEFGLLADITTIQPDDAAAAGTADRFARADHKHAIAAGAASTQTPDQANAEGISTSFARADHTHNIPAGTPSSTLAPSSTNAKGVAASFALSDHTHAHAMGLDADVSTILPDDAAATGTTDKFSRAGHKHAIATAAATSVSTSTTNTKGTSNSFARADHTHAVSVSNSEATATADATTASLTDVLLDSMTLTPAAGTYLVVFSSSGLNSANGTVRNYYSLYAGGSQQTGTERQLGVSGGAAGGVAIDGIVTVNGSQAVEIRWRVVGGTGTTYARKMSLIKLA